MNSSREYAEACSAFLPVTFVKVSTNSWGEIISPMTGKDFPEYLSGFENISNTAGPVAVVGSTNKIRILYCCWGCHLAKVNCNNQIGWKAKRILGKTTTYFKSSILFCPHYTNSTSCVLLILKYPPLPPPTHFRSIFDGWWYRHRNSCMYKNYLGPVSNTKILIYSIPPLRL